MLHTKNHLPSLSGLGGVVWMVQLITLSCVGLWEYKSNSILIIEHLLLLFSKIQKYIMYSLPVSWRRCQQQCSTHGHTDPISSITSQDSSRYPSPSSAYTSHTGNPDCVTPGLTGCIRQEPCPGAGHDHTQDHEHGQWGLEHHNCVQEGTVSKSWQLVIVTECGV